MIVNCSRIHRLQKCVSRTSMPCDRRLIVRKPSLLACGLLDKHGSAEFRRVYGRDGSRDHREVRSRVIESKKRASTHKYVLLCAGPYRDEPHCVALNNACCGCGRDIPIQVLRGDRLILVCHLSPSIPALMDQRSTNTAWVASHRCLGYDMVLRTDSHQHWPVVGERECCTMIVRSSLQSHVREAMDIASFKHHAGLPTQNR